MPQLGLPALLASVALTLTFVAARPLANAGKGLPAIFAAITGITLLAALVRLALLIGWWAIAALFAAAIASAMITRPAYKVGGRGDVAILIWTGYIVPLAAALCIWAWFAR